MSTSILLRAYVNQLLSLPKEERIKLADGWTAKRLAEKAARDANEAAKQAELRKQYGDWVDDPDFVEY